MAEIKIDPKLFHERISQFVNAWKTDNRTADNGVFASVSSILIMMGKMEDNPEFYKNNSMHVRLSSCNPSRPLLHRCSPVEQAVAETVASAKQNPNHAQSED
jgi:nucleosome binding factor SPN SPT16 subunit